MKKDDSVYIDHIVESLTKVGMRDKLIHDYFDVDLDTVWETATKDIPGLIPEIESLIQ